MGSIKRLELLTEVYCCWIYKVRKVPSKRGTRWSFLRLAEISYSSSVLFYTFRRLKLKADCLKETADFPVTGSMRKEIELISFIPRIPIHSLTYNYFLSTTSIMYAKRIGVYMRNMDLKWVEGQCNRRYFIYLNFARGGNKLHLGDNAQWIIFLMTLTNYKLCACIPHTLKLGNKTSMRVHYAC